jgi:hypothetical protein
MANSAEKLVKYTVKFMSKTYDINYEEAKAQCKKVIKMSKKFDEQLLGMMEELLDLSNVGSIEELAEFDIDVLKTYCRIKELDDSLPDKKIIESVWNNMQEEFELDSDSGSEDDSGSETEDDSGSEEEEPVPVPVAVAEPVKEKKKRVKIIE